MADKKVDSVIDFNSQIKNMQNHAVDYVKDLFPIIGNRNELHLKGVEIDESKPLSYEDEMKIKDRGQTLSDRVRIEVELKDKKGKVLDKKKLNAIDIPKITDRNSFIVKGNEYYVANQMRLDPGVYTYRDNAGEIQTQFNLEKGKNFKLNVDPRSQKFRLKLDTAHYDAYPVLKALGASDKEMYDAWGGEMLEKNRKESSDQDVDKIYRKLFNKKPSSKELMEKELKEYFDGTTMNPSTNRLTIDQEAGKADAGAMLAATRKYLDVAYGRKEQDERDDLVFQTMHTVDDQIKHRLNHAKDKVKRNMKFKVDSKDKIGNTISKKLLGGPVETFFTSSELSAPSEQINFLHNQTNAYKITRMGEGGVGSIQQITDKARNVHPSQFGFIDPYETVESSLVGITTALANGAAKREDGRFVTQLRNTSTGEIEWLTPLNVRESIVSFADQYDEKGKPLNKKVKAMKAGKPVEVKASEVQYVFPKTNSTYSLGSSLIPFQNSNQGNRTLMAAKQMTQHNFLKDREAPLVQVRSEKGSDKSLEEHIGETTSLRAPEDLKVTRVTKDSIYATTAKGEKVQFPLYNNFYTNQKSVLDHQPIVEAGQAVKKGDLIAESNNTKDGVWAPGSNMHIAYMPYKGKNYEDGVVISETAAKKLTSLHVHKHDFIPQDDDVLDKKKFMSHFPTLFTEKQLEKVDDKGMAKEGTILEYGDPIMLRAKKKIIRPEDIVLGRVSKKFDKPFSESSETWKYKFPGKVVRSRDGKTRVVRIKTEEPAVIGDKISGRHGNKGIIVDIVPDEEMPQTKEGKVVDMVLNPQGVIGRINPSQLLENALGKVAKKRGKAFKVENFHEGNSNHEYVQKQMKEYGVEEKDELIDGKTGKSYGKINNGYQTIMKLDHPVRKKFSARGVGPSYTSEMQPGRGEGGGQSIGNMEVYALLSHGAKENLREMSTIKSDRNDDFWHKLQSGQPYSMPAKTPFVTQKLFDYMKVLGVDLQRKGQYLNPVPMTSEQIKHLSSGEVKNGRILKAKDEKTIAEKDGIFDPAIFGGEGIDGRRWGHVQLNKKLPNPLFEDAIKGVLGLTSPQYDGLISGSHYLDKSGNVKSKSQSEKTSSEDDFMMSGPEAIEHMLKQVNPGSDLNKLRAEANETKSKTKRDQIFKKMKYLRGLKRLGAGTDSYMLDAVPVIPPQMRSVIPLPDGNMVVSDLNYAYKDLIGVNNSLKEDMEIGLGDEDKLTSDLYKTVKSVQGFGAPISYGKDYKGALDIVKGARNKTGYFQGKVVKRRQETSGRSTIIPNPSLGIDEVGIPEKMAWNIFEPHVKRAMSPYYKGLEARKHIDEKTPVARRFLEGVMNEKHVILNRAPTLHRGSMMAFKPHLVSGEAIQIPNLVTGPYNADFDGDCYDGFIHIKRNGRVERIHIKDFPHTDVVLKANDKVDEFEAEKGIEVLSFDEENFSWKWANVERFSVHKNLIHYDIEYKSGRKVHCSEDASLFVVPKGKLHPERTKPEDAIGCLSPNPNVLKLHNSVEKICLLPYNKGGKRRGSKLKNFDLDKKTGWVVGILAGDGWVNITSRSEQNWPKVCLANSDQNIKNEYYDQIQRIFNSPTITKQASEHVFMGCLSYSEKHIFSSEDFAWFVHEELGSGAHNKKLPSFLMEASEDFRWGVFCGLMDSDGYFGWSNSQGKKPQFQAKYDTKSEALKDDFAMLCWSLGMRTSITESRGGYVITIRTHDVKNSLDKMDVFHIRKKEALCKLLETELRFDQNDFIPVSENFAKEAYENYYSRFKNNQCKSDWSRVVVWQKAGNKLRVCRDSLKLAFEEFPSLSQTESGQTVHKILKSGITYDYIKKAQKLDGLVDMWDLTIPGSYTFLSSDGAALFDTMSVHVPASKAANEEADRMKPSSLIFSPRDKSLYFAPSQESVLGLYQMTRQDGKDTGLKFNSIREAMENQEKVGDLKNKVEINGIKAPLGSHLVNAGLPEGIREYDVEFGKGKIKEKLEAVAKESKEQFGSTVNLMKDLGNMASTGEGNTISVSDFTEFLPKRSKIMDRFDKEMRKLDGLRNPQQKYEKKIQTMEKTISELEKEQKDHFMKNKNNNVGAMFLSGSRGSAGQVRQTLGAPMLVRDFDDKPIDLPIRNSFIQGQSVIEDLFSAQSARYGTIKKVAGVAEPGAFAKSLIAANMRNPITIKDCGTSNGIYVAAKDAIGRNLAESISGVANKDDVFSTEDYSKAVKKKIDRIKIRAQTTCEAEQGICSMCYGIDEHGSMVSVGTNVGIIDAQSLSEPLTQASMKEFHKGGLAQSETPRAQGFDRIKQLYNVPENLPGMAILSEKDGKVEEVKKSPAGGLDITVSGETFYSPSPDASVQKGQSIKKGERLTDGYLRPQDVLRIKGKEEAQKYMIDELKKAFEDSGISADRRVYESIVNTQTSLGKVIESDHPDFLVGDVTKVNKLEGANKQGFKIKYEPIIKSVDRMPTEDTHESNLFQDMNFRELSKNIKKNVAFGNKTHFQNTINPIAAYVMGNFGKDDHGNRTKFY